MGRQLFTWYICILKFHPLVISQFDLCSPNKRSRNKCSWVIGDSVHPMWHIEIDSETNDLVEATFSATAGKLKIYIGGHKTTRWWWLKQNNMGELANIIYLSNPCIKGHSQNLVQWDARTCTHGTGVESGRKTDNFGNYVSSMFGYVGHSDAFKT